jgi:hypothetical protein
MWVTVVYVKYLGTLSFSETNFDSITYINYAVHTMATSCHMFKQCFENYFKISQIITDVPEKKL